MEEFEELFFKNYCDESLVEFITDQEVIFEEKNMEFKELTNKKRKITENNEKIRLFIESGEVVNFTEEDLQQLYNYFQLTTDISEEFEKELFYIGMREAYYLFRRLDMLK